MPSIYSAQLVSIEGVDAVAFAQAQFSSNVAALADGHWQFSAWLDAQGRVRALFHLLRLDGERLRLLLRGGEADVLAASLQRYVFRSKVRIEALRAGALATTQACPLHAIEQQTDALVLGCGTHGLRIGTHGDDAWRLPQVRACWPWLPDGLSGELLPASLGLVALEAAALDKGCYPGQEIVARLHYRGGNKRHLQHLHLSRTAPPGNVLHVGAEATVQLLDVVPLAEGAEALAIMHDDLTSRMRDGLYASHAQESLLIRLVEHGACTPAGAT